MVADDERYELLAWLRVAHHPLDSSDQEAPSEEDLAPLRAIVGDARVIGLGEAVRGAWSAAELRRFTHRILRFAVEHLGIRTLVLQDRPLA